MIYNRLVPFGLRSSVSKMIKKSLIAATCVYMNSTVKLKISPEKYSKEYDLAVIGGGSGGLATAF